MSMASRYEHSPNTILIDRYQIDKTLNYWSFSCLTDPLDGTKSDFSQIGIKYVARDLKFPQIVRYVSVKQLLQISDNQELNKLSRRNYEKEAFVLAALAHPNIVTIHDYFSIAVQSSTYIVTEYINGIDLENIVNSPLIDRLTPRDIVKWATQLCDAIMYMHEQKPPLLFRSLELSKIMIDTHGKIRLTDLSGAGVFRENTVGTLTGVDGYAAPEQYHGTHLPQSDIFSIGALLHHLLTQQNPRHYLRFSFHARRISKINPIVPKEMVEIIHKALEIDPEKRYQSARDMQDALKSLA